MEKIMRYLQVVLLRHRKRIQILTIEKGPRKGVVRHLEVILLDKPII